MESAYSVDNEGCYLPQNENLYFWGEVEQSCQCVRIIFIGFSFDKNNTKINFDVKYQILYKYIYQI